MLSVARRRNALCCQASRNHIQRITARVLRKDAPDKVSLFLNNLIGSEQVCRVRSRHDIGFCDDVVPEGMPRAGGLLSFFGNARPYTVWTHTGQRRGKAGTSQSV
jgi:hypothetical protein